MQRQWILLTCTLVAIISLAAGLSYAVYAFRPSLVTSSAENPPSNILIVGGNGVATADPDRVKISFGIVTQAMTSEEANSQNAQILSNLLAKLADAGIPKNQVETSAYNIYPVYQYPDKGQPVLVGYRAEHQLIVTVSSTEIGQLGTKAGAVIDLAVSAGASQVYGIQFAVSDSVMKDLENQALKNAVIDAQSKAGTMANALKVNLSGVRTVSESGYQPYPLPYRSFAGADAAKVPNELVPSPYKVQASVQVTYLISP
jgi:uncharacterized protein YggE